MADISEPIAAPQQSNGLSRLFRNPAFAFGLLLIAIILLAGITSIFWTPYDVTQLVITNRLKPPSWTHIFGTDHFGRDILSMLMLGARNSIAVAIVAVGIGVIIGVPLGCWAAARGGFVDAVLMRGNDVVFAFPALLSAVMITAIFGPGAVNAILAIGIFNIPVFARVARAGAMAIWPLDYVSAARAAGKARLASPLWKWAKRPTPHLWHRLPACPLRLNIASRLQIRAWAVLKT